MTEDQPGLRITRLLAGMSDGDPAARDAVFTLLYGELRRVAGSMVRGQSPGHTLQATALVHEAWIRISSLDGFDWKDRDHFFSVAAKAMRHVLVDHARGKARLKRSPPGAREPLDAVVLAFEERAADLLALEEALEKAARMDPQAVRILECRFFGGMSMEEISRALGIPLRTAERDWAHLRAWLRRELG